MKFWWVNHKQTYKDEVDGGYIWSPKTRVDGGVNQTYINLTLTQIDDVVFSYAGGEIRAIGRVTAACVEAPKPDFGDAGANWSNLGWRVAIHWTRLNRPLAPKSYLHVIAPLLPHKHSPIQASTGNGNQGCYLAALSHDLGMFLVDLAEWPLGTSPDDVVSNLSDATDVLEKQIQQSNELTDTEKSQLVRSRRGQGLFRSRAIALSARCCLTGVADVSLLVASHIKPWRDATNQERLDGHNGLMLAPHVDRLFDRGLITFDSSGEVMFMSDTVRAVAAQWHLQHQSLNTFTSQQKAYLTYHREHVFGCTDRA
jgi:putative restriction endonuclease